MYVTRPLSTTFGAEVLDFQLTENPSDEDTSAIKALWAEHKLLLFRTSRSMRRDSSGSVSGLVTSRSTFARNIYRRSIPRFLRLEHRARGQADRHPL